VRAVHAPKLVDEGDVEVHPSLLPSASAALGLVAAPRTSIESGRGGGASG